MTEPSPLRQYLRFAKRQAWLIVLVPVVTIVAAAFWTSQQPSVYRASMGIAVAERGARPPVGNPALAQTMKSLLKSNVVARRVVDRLGLPMSSSELVKDLRVQIQPDSSVLNVSYEATDKRAALSVVSEVAVAFQSLAREKLGVSTSLQQPGPLRIVASVFDPPHLEPDRVSPRPLRTLGFAGVLGVALGLILAFARESLDDRIRSRDEAEDAFGAPVIGALPRSFGARPRSSRSAHLRREADEALQLLRANLEAPAQKMGSTFLITSALDREKTANVVANLAMVMAEDGQEVVCVDADVRRPMLDHLLGVADLERGLLDVVEDGLAPEDALHEVELPRPSTNGSAAPRDREEGRLLLLPAGAAPADPSAVMSDRLRDIVAELSTPYRYVLVNSPGLLSPPNGAASIAPAVDSVLVVARQGRTRREWAEQVRLTLRTLGSERVGLVLTDVRKPLSMLSAE